MDVRFYRIFIIALLCSWSSLASEVNAPSPAEQTAAPAPVMRQGMKFIPLDRKKMIVRPLSKNQPVIIRPNSPIVNRQSIKKKTVTQNENYNPVRVNTVKTDNSVLSVFDPDSEGSQ